MALSIVQGYVSEAAPVPSSAAAATPVLDAAPVVTAAAGAGGPEESKTGEGPIAVGGKPRQVIRKRKRLSPEFCSVSTSLWLRVFYPCGC